MLAAAERAKQRPSVVTDFSLYGKRIVAPAEALNAAAVLWRDAAKMLGEVEAKRFAVSALERACAAFAMEERGVPDQAALARDPEASRRLVGAIGLCIHACVTSWPDPGTARDPSAEKPRRLH